MKDLGKRWQAGLVLVAASLLSSCAEGGVPTPSDRLAMRAHRALLSGDLPTALRLDREALAESPGDVALMNNLAVVLWKTGKKAEAKSLLDLALSRDPDNPLFLMNLARIELSLGHAKAAYEDASRIIVLDRWPNGFRTLMGKIDIDRASYGEAHIYLHEAQERHPGNPLILTYLGIVYYRIGKPEDAASSFRSALALNPSAGLARTLRHLLSDPGKVLGRPHSSPGLFQKMFPPPK